MKNYSIENLIGEGTFGKIFKAARISDKLSVYIKRIQTAQIGAVTNLIKTEMNSLEGTNNRNIMSISSLEEIFVL
jgi:serine/threonine protein kinase